jgi:hypothetical protein
MRRIFYLHGELLMGVTVAPTSWSLADPAYYALLVADAAYSY